MLNMHPTLAEEHPEVARFFERMTFLPLEKVTAMVPPGGAGIGMHVIPVEKAIPAKQESISIEHISHWLDKYDGHIGVGVCSCRRSETIQGRGSGDIKADWCVAVGEFADYLVETGKGRRIDKEEALRIFQRAEDLGYVHQITNIDGENKIFGMCNCAPGVCYALRTSQLFNTPNMSRSAYVAHVDKEKCVACGKCVEVCPAGAARLGQKLCTKQGPVSYPKHELPDAAKWGPEKWSPNYKELNQLNCYDTGTSPCKTACPAHIAVQGYLKMAAQGRYLDALKLIKQDNPFPAVCGSDLQPPLRGGLHPRHHRPRRGHRRDQEVRRRAGAEGRDPLHPAGEELQARSQLPLPPEDRRHRRRPRRPELRLLSGQYGLRERHRL